MLIHITEKCSMGCPHCMDDAMPDGQHMPFSVFEKAVDFVIRNNIYHGIIITGGEPTENPEFPMLMGYLIATLAKKNLQSIITVTTNGMWLLEDSENVKVAKTMVQGVDGIEVMDTGPRRGEIPRHGELGGFAALGERLGRIQVRPDPLSVHLISHADGISRRPDDGFAVPLGAGGGLLTRKHQPRFEGVGDGFLAPGQGQGRDDGVKESLHG